MTHPASPFKIKYLKILKHSDFIDLQKYAAHAVARVSRMIDSICPCIETLNLYTVI